jgi:hypothetical protein
MITNNSGKKKAVGAKSHYNMGIKVSQSTIDKIKSQGMTKALKKAGKNPVAAGTTPKTKRQAQYVEGVRRLYGQERFINAINKPKASPSPVTKMSPRAAERAKPTKMSPRAAENAAKKKTTTARSPRATENAAKKKTTTARSPRAAENAAKKKTTTARSPRAAERAAANGRSSGRGGISQSQR